MSATLKLAGQRLLVSQNMLHWLVFIRVEVVEVLLEVSDSDGLHGDLHLQGTEVLRMSLDRLQHILGQFINNISSPGKLETEHSLYIC